MVRKYKIFWYANKDKIERCNWVKLSKPTGEVSIDAKAALNVFIAAYGNLKKNTIIKIQEFDENGQIGEDIKPNAETAILPTI